ncbi:MAG: hypothetical protein ACRDY1_08210 [Acidimicrobiales bacterium]
MTMNVFDITARCPLCGGQPLPRYEAADDAHGPLLRRDCRDCGFGWDVRPVTREI